jgi:hypothetical protein
MIASGVVAVRRQQREERVTQNPCLAVGSVDCGVTPQARRQPANRPIMMAKGAKGRAL